MNKLRSLLLAAGLAALLTPAVQAWDYEGHRLINGVALASLPKDFPAFVRAPANTERILFLAGEPDRWRNAADDLPLQQVNGTNHYLDYEQLAEAGLDPAKVPSFRYDFVTTFAAARAKNIAHFEPIDPKRNKEHSQEWPGFAPWQATEMFGQLRSAFSYLRAYEERGTPEEVAQAQANILYIMGVMGHYVGDCSQPLHATAHHHGWVGPNPKGYTTWRGIHSWMDGGFLAKAGIKLTDLLPQVETSLPISLAPREDGRDPMFVKFMEYVTAQNAQVEPLYALEKAGKLGHHEQPITDEGRRFVTGQLVVGGEMLGAMWATAWKTAAPDTYLLNYLANRKARAQGLRPPPESPLPAKSAK
ncbi:hypothetical protein [Opitutus sp. ER46]|uniref:hypothetical protein n=1 Tax=Opitutus sp. ER46 TaxID=2161864 RepID=UPI000D302524|nr:hypothetical protein [Opitutus sp. ER46]PTX97800.1 hypothetical protein DB354_05850 [Opitutus sp. ER46]